MLIDIPVDFSALATLACGRKYQLACAMGLDTSSKDTNWGSGFHKYREARNMGCEEQVPNLVLPIAAEYKLEPPEATKLLTAALSYDNTQPIILPARDNTNRPLVEWKFSFPYLTTDKYRILLCGTVDFIYIKRCLVFRDYKTTNKTRELDAHEASYIASFQIPFYLYCIQHHLAHLLGDQARDLAEAGHLYGEYQNIYKNFTPPKITESSPIRPWDREEVEAVLHPLIGKILSIHDRADMYPLEGTVTGACKNCAFFNACLCYDDEQRDNMLANFPRRIYDPMKFR